MTILPPITGTPLDYVPIDATIAPATPTHFRPPTLRRAAIAAIVAGISVAAFILAPAVFIGAVAIAFIGGCVWGTDKLIKVIDSHGE
ncbi:hypothetical protein [Rhizobium laguerreae]|uniref:hypothetical protein n=1 Tax=Rhizobium laguerreae TaxID=1076926 RepID=UPI001C914C1C|nr:hypothetical protein [Rhizobium laguerreae]MBY3434865.1 hypothetical protein [Rhizobium laguerreae]MBY3449007.1 hypothetical protein [Rhizobium laguerreae]MBY3456781.1 hypothetical protein [Rhizobium laguerreae]